MALIFSFMFLCVIDVGRRSAACHRRSGQQVLSRSGALISQPFCCRRQVSEMMLTLMGGGNMCGWISYLENSNCDQSNLFMLIFALEK